MNDSNMKLDIGFKGQLKLNAQVVPLQEGYLKIGGIAYENLPFGRVVASDSNTPNTFFLGSGDVIRGITVFDDAIAQNAPAHPNEYLKGFPCAVLNHGFVWIEDYTGEVEMNGDVYYDETTGVIGFAAGSGKVKLENASIREIDEEKGVLIYLN